MDGVVPMSLSLARKTGCDWPPVQVVTCIVDSSGAAVSDMSVLYKAPARVRVPQIDLLPAWQAP
jgi:hypothetical protein